MLLPDCVAGVDSCCVLLHIHSSTFPLIDGLLHMTKHRGSCYHLPLSDWEHLSSWIHINTDVICPSLFGLQMTHGHSSASSPQLPVPCNDKPYDPSTETRCRNVSAHRPRNSRPSPPHIPVFPTPQAMTSSLRTCFPDTAVKMTSSVHASPSTLTSLGI